MIWELAKGSNVAVTSRILRKFREDADLRAQCRPLLGEKRWMDQFLFWGSELSDYFVDDQEAQRIIFEQMGRLQDPEKLDYRLVAALRGYDRAKDRLIELATSPGTDPNIMSAARSALPNEPRVHEVALEELGSQDKFTVRRAAELLKNDPVAFAELAKLERHSDKHVREVAYLALARLGRLPDVYKDLAREEDEPALRRELVARIDSYRWANPVEKRIVVLRAMGDYDWQTRKAAAEHLRRSAPPAKGGATALRAVGATLHRARLFADEREIVQRDDRELFDAAVVWMTAKLVSTMPSEDWTVARTHIDEADLLLGELIQVEENNEQRILVRLAKDSFELPRDRDIWPAANVVFAWQLGQRLRAMKPTVIVVVCADVSDADAIALSPQLRPGEIRIGPTVFGFRLKEEGATDHRTLAS
jgi:hypothetical protein